MNSSEVLQATAALLGADRLPLLERLTQGDCVDALWYLETKILGAADDEERLDNTRPLKYAYNFCKAGGSVTFLREESGRKTPDFLVRVDGVRLYLEVRKFRLQADSSAHPVAKIADAVRLKRTQLPRGELGFVAIDNFDMSIEHALTHTNIAEALCELERAAGEHPEGWDRPCGVIFAACTPGRLNSNRFPHFVWANPHSQPGCPGWLCEWLSAALPDGLVFDPNGCRNRETEVTAS